MQRDGDPCERAPIGVGSTPVDKRAHYVRGVLLHQRGVYPCSVVCVELAQLQLHSHGRHLNWPGEGHVHPLL
jgi:hypothetical protein